MENKENNPQGNLEVEDLENGNGRCREMTLVFYLCQTNLPWGVHIQNVGPTNYVNMARPNQKSVYFNRLFRNPLHEKAELTENRVNAKNAIVTRKPKYQNLHNETAVSSANLSKVEENTQSWPAHSLYGKELCRK